MVLQKTITIGRTDQCGTCKGQQMPARNLSLKLWFVWWNWLLNNKAGAIYYAIRMRSMQWRREINQKPLLVRILKY